MIEFEIEPHVGVGPIRLGMSRDEVRAAFPKSKVVTRDNRDIFLSDFMVDYDENGNVEFIELAASRKFRALYKGSCLHEMPADETVAFVQQYGSYSENDRELGYSYRFLDLQLSLWRPTIPEPDQPEDDDDGRYFEAVGIARSGYFT